MPVRLAARTVFVSALKRDVFTRRQWLACCRDRGSIESAKHDCRRCHWARRPETWPQRPAVLATSRAGNLGLLRSARLGALLTTARSSSPPAPNTTRPSPPRLALPALFPRIIIRQYRNPEPGSLTALESTGRRQSRRTLPCRHWKSQRNPTSLFESERCPPGEKDHAPPAFSFDPP
jgi:hypothetical protein